MYLNITIMIAIISISIIISLLYPLPGTTHFKQYNFKQYNFKEGLISKNSIETPEFDISYPYLQATHPPTDFAVEAAHKTEQQNIKISNKILKRAMKARRLRE